MTGSGTQGERDKACMGKRGDTDSLERQKGSSCIFCSEPAAVAHGAAEQAITLTTLT